MLLLPGAVDLADQGRQVSIWALLISSLQMHQVHSGKMNSQTLKTSGKIRHHSMVVLILFMNLMGEYVTEFISVPELLDFFGLPS